MIQLIKDIIFAWRYKRAVKQAARLQRLNRCKYLVLVVNGKLKVVAKKDIRLMIATRRFKKGTKVQDIERRALYTTH